MDNPQAKRDDLNWLAGHFEGEGTLCLSQRSSGNGIQPTIAYTNTDEELAGEYAAVVKRWISGCHVRKYSYNSDKHHAQYRIALCGYKRCVKFLNEVLPYLRSRNQYRRAALMRDFLQSRLETSPGWPNSRQWQRYSDAEVELAETFWEVNSSRRGLRDQMPGIRAKAARMKIESTPKKKSSGNV